MNIALYFSTIVNKKDRMLKKGSGYHLDIVVIGLLTIVGGFLGAPFMVAATVRSVAHISALSVFSRTHAPGENPKLERVFEQRLTALAVHILIGKLRLFFHQLLYIFLISKCIVNRNGDLKMQKPDCLDFCSPMLFTAFLCYAATFLTATLHYITESNLVYVNYNIK